MTQPTIVITLEGGLVQGIAVSHQATIIVVDYDVEGTSNDVYRVGGGDAVICSQDMLPSEEQDIWIAEVLESLK